MLADEEIRKLTNSKTSTDDIRKAAVKAGMHTLRQDGDEKVKQGITTQEEVMRVTEEA